MEKSPRPVGSMNIETFSFKISSNDCKRLDNHFLEIYQLKKLYIFIEEQEQPLPRNGAGGCFPCYKDWKAGQNVKNSGKISSLLVASDEAAFEALSLKIDLFYNPTRR